MEDSGIDSDPKPMNDVDDDNVFTASDSSNSSNNHIVLPRSTTKQLQRKLEARIEQAKRIQRNAEYTKLPDREPDNCGSGHNSSLIPIQRLPIPQKRRKQNALIEFWHSDTDSEDELTLFSTSRDKNPKHKQDLTDTFSVEEVSDESDDSLHLGAPPEFDPHTRTYMPSGCFSCHCKII
ncbi:hypothetical protein QAD02_022451 [Eretmocerus hayati]|uniref:Uncharacterized protein n=1 Tax=Eretmocerus hayati TaxID=131215 RepID=A0ACC2PTB8_9HYME|nr:hypothetical protein QAD02_022451 [Eretmocerus hayati]